MAVETLLDFLTGCWVRLVNDTDTSLSASRDVDSSEPSAVNFTPSLFEAEPGQFRLLQPVWDFCVGRQWAVSSPLFPIVLAVVFYFGCMLPFTLIDLFGSEWKWIHRYKIQPRRVVTWPAVRNAVVLTVWNHVLYILPVSVAQCAWTPNTHLPTLAPRLWEFTWQQCAALVVFDAEYYAWHYLHHRIRWLYRHVHSVHHQYSSPNCWVTQYLHPYELTVVGICTTTCPWCFSAHPLTQWSFMLFCIALSVEAHIGYDLPLTPHHWLPFWGGSVKHDMHHQRPLTNYQPFFTWFDLLFSTECPGQCASGYRPPTLINWERKRRAEAVEAKAAASLTGAGGATEAVLDEVDVNHLGNYGSDEPIMEGKRL